jgi:hypothetical protein
MRTILSAQNIPELIRYLNEILVDVYREFEQIKSQAGEFKLDGDMSLDGHRIKNLAKVPTDPKDAINLHHFENNPAGKFVVPVDIGTSNQLGDSEAYNTGKHVHNHPDLPSDLHSVYFLADGTRVLVADAKIYWGPVANGNYFFFLLLRVLGNFMWVEC